MTKMIAKIALSRMNEKHKACFKCGETKPLSAFYKHPMMADGHVNKCKECNKRDVILNRLDKVEYYNEYDRNRSYVGSERSNAQKEAIRIKYRESEDFRNKRRDTLAKQRRDHPDKAGARQALSNAVRDNRITKPKVCSACGKTDCSIQGHHWSYLEEHWLDVVWLCTECHGKEHRKINAEARKAAKLNTQPT